MKTRSSRFSLPPLVKSVASEATVPVNFNDPTVNPGLQDHRDPQGHQDQMDPPEILVPSDRPELHLNRAHQSTCLASTVQLAPKEDLVNLDRRDQADKLDNRALLEVHQPELDPQAPQDQKDHLDHPDHLGNQDNQASQASPDLDRVTFLESLDPADHPGQMESREHREALDNLAAPDHSDHLGTTVHLDSQDRRDSRDNPAHLERREKTLLIAHVHLEPLVLLQLLLQSRQAHKLLFQY